MNLLSKRFLARILPVTWTQPTLSANGNYGTDEFAVYRGHSGGSFSGGDAWQAFATTSGYSGYWSGNYGNEYSTTLNFFMASKKPIKVTGFYCYYPCTDSSSDWGSIAEGWFYGSNDNNNWTQLMYHGSYGANNANSQTFSNNNYYKYHKYTVRSHGGGHKDLIQVSSIRLTAVYEDFV